MKNEEILKTCVNDDAEQMLLAGMTIGDGRYVAEALKIVDETDFYYSEHSIIFKALVNLYSRGIAPLSGDGIAFIEEMKKLGVKDEEKIKYAYEVFGRTYTGAYVPQHAKIVKEKSDLRRLQILTNEMTAAIQEGRKSASDIVGDVSTALSKFSDADETARFSRLGDYFTNDYDFEVEEMQKYAERGTGFSNIDERQIFSPGVYILGATPAAGKTTFAYQMAEQLARKGETCIFCSFEMSRLELFTKSISRRLFLNNSKAKLTAAEIRRGGWKNDEVKKIVEKMKTDKSDLRVLELHDTTADDLLKILRPVCTGKWKAPIIFIDYLQIIKSNKDNAKNAIDDTLDKLKNFQRETNATFIVVSSLNRQNYNQQIAFESFKESGGIEYGVDCIWGLQLNVMNQMTKSMETSDIRKKIDDAKRQQPRQIQLKCLKNRQGQNYDCYFKYYSAHDLFVPCKESDFKNDETEDDEDED